MRMSRELEEKLRLLPRRSGVYLFRDAKGSVLYVGKAVRLHLRVSSYFRGRRHADVRIGMLVDRVADIETIVTGTESEALILESNLIKRYRPPFNIELKDDKSYPFLKLTARHRFPGLFITRRVVQDGSRYFGPYTHVKNLRQTLKTLRKVFPLRNCTDRRLERDERECLEYFIERCPAPCTAKIDPDRYGIIVRRLTRFLEGDIGSVVDELRGQMLAAASSLRFEESAALRDSIETLERLVAEQRMTPALTSDTDVIGVVARGDRASCVVLHVQDGKVLGKRQSLLIRAGGASTSEVLRTFLLASYLEAFSPPPTLAVPFSPREEAAVSRTLRERWGKPVELKVPRTGVLVRLLRLARENAHFHLEQQELRERQRRADVDAGVYALQEALDLSRTPYTIEGFDVSNLQATYPVASLVTFRDGSPLKSGYRRFRIKGVQGPDDFSMIEEAIRRRLQRLKSEGGEPPDLILVDGGAGQVGRAASVLTDEGFGEIQLLGLAKREELIHLPGAAEPIRLQRNSEALRLLQRIRNEAHRFAIGYHRLLRAKGQVRSGLDTVPGIGRKRRAQLLRHFGSIEAIRRASPEALQRVPGIGSRTAHSILDALSNMAPTRRTGA